MKQIFLIFILFIVIKGNAQNERDSNIAYINSYCVISNDFKEILDSFLIHEAQYSYFSFSDTNVVFPITVLDSVGNIIQLTSGRKGFFIHKSSSNNIFGILKYKGISFIVNGRTAPNQKILNGTNKKVKVPIKISNKDIEPIEDDRFFPTVWITNLENGEIKIVYKSKMKGEY